MGLEIVLKEIEDSANREIEAINAEALKQSEEIIENARKKVREALGIRLANVEEQISRKRQQVISSANLEVKRIYLNKKKELLDNVYLKVCDVINSMTNEKNEALLKELICKYEYSGSKIYSNSKSEDIVKKLSKLKYSGNIICDGGIIIENEDGNIRQDYTYNLILQRVYERSLKQISDILY